MNYYEERAKKYKAAIKKRYQDSLEFWETFTFPVKFHVEVKEVLSGLSESSSGNGQKKSSKIHLILDEDFSNGRLKRTKGDFLCSQQKKYGNWSGQNDEQYFCYIDRDTKYVPAITCQECLKKAKRFQYI
jgi:hypothetical protein